MDTTLEELSAGALEELLKKKEIPNIPLLEDFFKNSPFERISIDTLSKEDLLCGQGKGFVKDSEKSVDLEFRFYELDDKILGFEFRALEVSFDSILARPVASFISAAAVGQNSCKFVYSSMFNKPISIKFGIEVWGKEVYGFFPESEKSDIKIGTWFVEPFGLKDVGNQLEYLSNVDLTSWVPEGINQAIKLSGFQVVWSQSLNKITFATFNFDLEDWPLLPEFQFKDVEAELFVSQSGPLGGGLAASLHLGASESVIIQCYAELRKGAFTIQGALEKELSLSKIQLFKDISFPDVTINDLELYLEKNADQTDISFRLEIGSGWKGLSSVVFFANLSYSGETVSKRGGIEAVLEIGSSAILVGARYEEEDWVFKGATSQIEIGSLLIFFSEKLKIPAPNFLKGVALKDLSLQYYSKSGFYTFQLSLSIPLNQKSFDLQLEVKHSETTKYSGTLQLYKMSFKGSFKNEEFAASWKGNMKLSDFIGQIGISSGFGELDIEITAVELSYNFGSKDWVFKIDLGTTKFYVQAEGEKYSMGFEMADFSIDQLPAIGKIPAAIVPQIKGLQVGYHSDDGLAFSGDLQIGTEKPIAIAPKEEKVETSNFPAKSEEKTKWIQIQKTVGTLHLERIGMEFQEGKIGFLVDLSMQGGGLTVSAVGVKVESPITAFKPELSIQGLGIGFKQGPIEMAGGLVHRDDEFMGDLIITTPTFSIKAIGAYSEVEGNPSLFVFAHLKYPLGGPPFFFVTGLAAGFGFNRQLKIPGVNEIANFPFVKWVVNKNSPDSVGAVIANLASSGIVSPAFGANWLAFGVQFTVFKLIDAFALAILKFGSRVEMDLLGLATLILPDKAFKYVKAELQIKATFIPDEGVLGIAGSLTKNSYVFHPDCHLTGGFAYFTWMKGPHAGDFVVTMGGYGKKFRPPAHYPKVNPLGLSWKIGALNIKGNLYFAMTPKALMAGGYLSAVWQSGGIRAWFNVQADFLMYYSPFQFYMKASISLGASFEIDLWITTVTMSIHLGVALVIQGPEFYGTAKIDLSIISFTIAFGESKKPEAYLEWNEFSQKYIPKKEGKFFDFQIVKGLVKEEKGQHVVNGEHLECLFSTSIPVNKELVVGPMGNKKLSSTIKSAITKDNKAFSGLTLLKTTGKIPNSLWGPQDLERKRPSGDPTRDSVISNVHLGYKINPKPRPIPSQTEKKSLEELILEKNECDLPWNTPTFSKGERGSDDLSKVSSEKIKKSIQTLGDEFAFLLSDLEVSELAKCLFISPANQPIDIDDRGLHV